MEQTTIDLLGDDFKKEVARRDNIIRALRTQQDELEKTIASQNEQVIALQSKIDGMNESVKQANDDLDKKLKERSDAFDASQVATILSLEERENKLIEHQHDLQDAKDDHNSNIGELNERKESLEKIKESIISELKDMAASVNDEITKSIGNINSI